MKEKLELLNHSAVLIGWVFLIIGWVVFGVECHTGHTLIPLIFFGTSLAIYLYDVIR